MFPKVVCWLLLSTGCLMFLSCSENDQNWLGTYEILGIETTRCSDPAENLSFDFSAPGGCGVQQGVEFCGDGTITLRGDNTFSLRLSMRVAKDAMFTSSSGSFEIDGNSITVCEDGQCETGMFDVENGTITLSYPDGSCVVTIRGEKQF